MDTGPQRPDHVVVVLLDSLNRHLLGAYGGTDGATPQLDRFAAGATRFTNHHAGSLPCIPARHDLLCGSLDFLWRPWGSIEVWEDAITRQLRAAGVTTQLVTDHPHLFEVGGENYHTDFSAWEYLRGHESDPWRTREDPSAIGAPRLPAVAAARHPHPYDVSRTWFRGEDDLPGPRTLAYAAEWIRSTQQHHERSLLVVDEFDPHEPWDVPDVWAQRFDPTWEGPRLIWPPYGSEVVARGVLTDREAKHLRAMYLAKLTMIDHWFGGILDALDEVADHERTAVVVCTDHGHYLGERDLFGKPGVPLWSPMEHVPLLVRWPGVAPGDIDALTTSVDLHATLCDAFGVEPQHRVHGVSVLPLLDGSATSVRDWALAGVWGRQVHLHDGHRKYVRAPVEGNRPLEMWSNRWSTMPVSFLPELRLPRPDRRARLEVAPGADVPVLCQPFGPGDLLPFWAYGDDLGSSMAFDLDEDPAEQHDLAGTAVEDELAEQLRDALLEVEAPAEQLVRLGLA